MTRGAPHPNLGGVYCDVSKPNHPECTGWSDLGQDYVDWPNPDHVPSKRVTGGKQAVAQPLRAAARRVQPAPAVGTLSGFAAGLEGSERAASRWDEAQTAMVDDAIVAVAKAHAGGGEFTTDAIWAHLNGAVPVTKGLTGRLQRARHRGIIDNTGKHEISQRGGHHDHGQRLTVWYSLLS